MLKIIKKPMLKLLIGAMFISLIPTRIVFATDMVINDTQTTEAGSSLNGINTTTGAAVIVSEGNTTTGAAVNINEGDITAPDFNNVSIDKKSATTGDTLTVTVEASDDMSGINNISVFYKAPAGSASKGTSLRKISEGKYSGTLTIGVNDAVGTWKVDFISLNDNASNSIYVSNSETNKYANILKDLSAGDFEISGTTPDITPPVFNSVSIDKKSATTGDTLTVTVEASDDMSGIDNISIFYKAPAGNASKGASLRKISDGKYSGTLTIGANDAVGVWKVDFISLSDKASNSIYITNSETNNYASILKDLSVGDFEISGTTPDITPPVFNNISIDKKIVSKGEKVTVTIEASDDISGIKNISVFYKAPAGNASKGVSLIKISDGKYSGTLTVGLNDAVGVWKVDFISLSDNTSNSIYVSNSETNKYANILEDLSSGDFEVNSTVLDPIVTPPTDEPTEELPMPTSIRISGTERVGNMLSAKIMKDNTEFVADPSVNVIYEWFRLDNEYSKNGELVGRDKTYQLVSNDLGKYIKLVVYCNNKKVDEDITSNIVKATSSSNSSSSSSNNSNSSSNGNSSSSSSSNSNSSSNNSSGSSSNSNNTSTSSNNNSSGNSSTSSNTSDSTTVTYTNSTVAETAKVEKNQDGTIKLVNKDGQPAAGWQQVDGKWYLADATGIAQTGWKQTNSAWYLLNNDGVMATGWQQVNGAWYLLKDNGAMATGWQQTNGKWYYLYSNGSMASNTVIDGYRVDASGAWV